VPQVLNARVVGMKEAPDRVRIDRRTKWGNPFVIGTDGDRVDVVELYADYIMTNEELLTDLDELVGKDLICWCAPQACHGDVLMALANPT
jgi:uncharacterized protein (DUF433 family)